MINTVACEVRDAGASAKHYRTQAGACYLLLTLLLNFLGCINGATAQNFRSDTLDLSIVADTIIAVELTQDEWVDYWIAGTDAEGQRGYWIYQNLGDYTFTPKSVPAVALVQPTFAFADFDRNNQLDVVVSGRTAANEPLTQVYYNQGGNFSAPPLIINRRQAHTLGCADFNQDGRLDIFLNGRSVADSAVAELFLNANERFLPKTVAVAPTASGTTLIYDWDNDGRADILQTGVSPEGEIVTQLYQNRGKLRFERRDIELPTLSATALATGDVNHDGRADLLLSGVDTTGRARTYLYAYRDSLYAPVAIELPEVVGTLATLADYNHDGLTDVGLVGQGTSEVPVARWYFQSEAGWMMESYDSLATPGGTYAIGDVDNDGHLDVLRGGTSEAASLLWVNRSPGNNAGPNAPTEPMVSTIDTLTVFRWSATTDDKTPSPAFTYEMYVLPESTSQFAWSPEYQDTTKARVDHGRLGYGTTHTISGLAEGTYFWDVAPVDNAFQLGTSCANGRGGSPLCFTVERADTTVCAGTTLRLTTPTEVRWESQRTGSVVQTRALAYVVRGDDVLYYTATSDTACALTYSLRVQALPYDADSLLMADTTVCANETLTLAVDSDYTSVTWFSAAQGELVKGQVLTWTATQEDILWVAAQIADQCPVWDTMTVALYPPVALVAEDTLRIVAGSSVTLVATGAETYQWSPANGLGRTTIADPVAAPNETTTYAVEGITANGCLVRDTVTVQVEREPTEPVPALFVPNLFSPNGDGQNDAFRLYGENIQSVTWQVYDRQGTRLFEAKRLDEGWNGQYQGRDVPTGVYIWKIAGKYRNGTPLQFEGEQSGMLRLVR